jgi:membrane protein
MKSELSSSLDRVKVTPPRQTSDTAKPWLKVLQDLVRDIRKDNCLGLAAQLAFFFLLSLFPALLFLVALIGYLPVENAMVELLSALSAVAPHEFVVLVRTQLDDLVRGGWAGFLTLGLAGAFWSSSTAMVATIDALNRAYNVPEWRPWWKRRMVAIALTVALAIFTAISLALILIGPSVANRVARWFGVAPLMAAFWSIARWPAMIFCVVFGVDLVYHFAPNRKARWSWLTPGSVIATALWILISFGFKLYVTNFSHYNVTYGAISGVIIVLLWLYVSGLAILIGAELNSVLPAATSKRRVS